MARLVPEVKVSGFEQAHTELMHLEVQHRNRMVSWWETWSPALGHKQLFTLVLNSTSGSPTVRAASGGQAHPLNAPMFSQVSGSSTRFEFAQSHLDSSAIFSSVTVGGTTRIVLNSSHPLFRYIVEVIDPKQFANTSNDVRLDYALKALQLLITSWVSYEEELPGKIREGATQSRLDWGRVARRMCVDVNVD